MIFKNQYITVYCNNDYYEEFDTGAILCRTNTGTYYRGHLIHREDGPAVEYSNGSKYWYLNGKEYSEQEYLNIISLKSKSRILDEV